jgi:membrane fusion protein, copper/silver efflux system
MTAMALTHDPVRIARTLAVLTLLAVAGCERPPDAVGPAPGAPPAAVEEHEVRVEGRIESIDIENRSVVISHEPVEALGWPAMTMNFRVDDPNVVTAVREGQRVRFFFEEGPPGSYVVTDIQPVD